LSAILEARESAFIVLQSFERCGENIAGEYFFRYSREPIQKFDEIPTIGTEKFRYYGSRAAGDISSRLKELMPRILLGK
jgi:hypothetical protein